jgi:hypothetical protein
MVRHFIKGKMEFGLVPEDVEDDSFNSWFQPSLVPSMNGEGKTEGIKVQQTGYNVEPGRRCSILHHNEE